jgi:phosphoribosyl-ATP pyrophosphohydrolase
MSEDILSRIDDILEIRKRSSAGKSYTKGLFDKGINEILSKIQEESEELIQAAASNDSDNRNKIIYETADLWFHVMVLLSNEDIKSKEILQELEKRFGLSGLDEKASRKEQ